MQLFPWYSGSILVGIIGRIQVRGLHFGNNNRLALAATAMAAFLILACSAFAQGGAMSPYENEKDGVSAGGKWTEFASEDKMTGAKKVRFELLADNYFREDPEFPP